MAGLSAKPDEDLLIAGIVDHGLFASRAGSPWQPLDTEAVDAGGIANRMGVLVYDPQHPMTFWESGSYGPGVYRTDDDGKTFIQLGDLGGAGDHTGSDLVSIDFTDANRKTLLAGSHEQSQAVFLSKDGGMTWNNVGGALPAATNCAYPLIITASTFLVGCAGYGGGPHGIYRTTDGATTWTQVSATGGGSAPLHASDGTIYWASPDGALVTGSFQDEGQHWKVMVQPNSFLANHPPVELPGGDIAAIGTQVIVVSPDHGASWTAASSDLPYTGQDPPPAGLVYSSQRQAFYIYHFTCAFDGGPVYVPDDAVMRFDYVAANHGD
jgi:hypothetical protein